MTHRMEISESKGSARIEFQGTLDREALEDILACVRESQARGTHRITLLLGSGTDVARECMEPLRRIDGLTIEAVSPFLARWMRQTSAD